MTVAAHQVDLTIRVHNAALPGTLTIPGRAQGLVIFAHGSGSGRLSPRNIAVSNWLVSRGCATLLFDLLSPSEAADRRNVFDIELLGSRMVEVTRHVRTLERGVDTSSEIPAGLPVGYFGASTGAAAALVAAADLGYEVNAIVSRGGRPDLAGKSLTRVTAPTLLLVGSLDTDVIELNRWAQERLTCESELIIVPGASHLFEEPGTLEEVATHAADWFVRHFEASRR